MKPEKAMREFGDIADKYINEADMRVSKKSTGIKRAVAIAACVVLLAAAFVLIRMNPKPSAVPEVSNNASSADESAPGVRETDADFRNACIAAPVLKQFPPYPDYEKLSEGFSKGLSDSDFSAAVDLWSAAKKEVNGIEETYRESLACFTEKAVREFVQKNADKNCVFSPVNVYLALAMSAELADGEARAQILSLLGVNDIESLQKNAGNLFNKTFFNDGAYICVPSASVWLNNAVSYEQNTLHTLADVYGAYSFSGKPGSAEYDETLHSWLNYATGGLLRNSVNSLKMLPDAVMTLVTSLYLSAKWQSEFRQTEAGVFHSPDGDAECEYMLKNEQSELYYANGFTAKAVPIEGGGYLWIILPDKDSSVEAVLSDDDFYAFIKDPLSWSQKKNCYVKMRLPKFDVSFDADMKEGLQNLGVTDIFLPDRADFSNLTEAPGIYVDKLQHCARVKTDEKGITAAAFTVIELAGASIPNDEADFIVDRPFIFTVTGGSNSTAGAYASVLFSGTVNKP